MSSLFNFISACLVVSIGSASASTRYAESKEAVKSARVVTQSFGIEQTKAKPDLEVDQAKISIAKSALDKEFLFQGSLLIQPIVPSWNGLKSRIVSFKKHGDKIFMMEATKGHQVNNELPQNLILSDFPILSETADKITFDFNVGMSSIFMMNDWGAQDFSGPWYDPASQFQTLKSRSSYIENAQFKNNRLAIRQILQLVIPSGGYEYAYPTEVRYFISPYQPDPTFEPTKSKDMKRTGFFEVAPQLASQGPDVIYASKFNLNKPIVFAVSANTPAAYRDAVKEGILYWNKALGKDLIQVVDAPAGVTPPDLDYNIVQWVTWDDAGGAYADAQMDPRTGEITNAQVFMTSVFAVSTIGEARMMLHELTGKENGKESLERYDIRKNHRAFGLRGFEKDVMCNHPIHDSYVKMMSDLVAQGSDDSVILKASQDMVRGVVAHEVGHDLGLRHNFAGTLAANYPMSQRETLLKTYFEKGSIAEDTVISSSVMDYHVTQDEMINGDKVKKLPKALSYDEKAIQTLYFKKKYSNSEIPLFCTDTSVLEFTDCELFDYGSSAVDYAVADVDYSIKQIPSLMLAQYIRSRAPALGYDPKPLDEVLFFTPDSAALWSLYARIFAVQSLHTGGRSLQVERSFPAVTSFNQEAVRKAYLDYETKEVERMGGVATVFKSFTQNKNLADELTNQFGKMLDSARKGVGYAGQPYEFTYMETEYMKSQASAFFKKFQMALVKQDVNILSGSGFLKGKLENFEVADKFASHLKKLSEDVIYGSSNDNAITADIEVIQMTSAVPVTRTVSAKFPSFAYPYDVRLAAATNLLSRDRSVEPATWGYVERVELKEGFDKIMQQSLVGVTAADQINMTKLQKPAFKWLYENRYIAATLLSKTN